MSMSSTFFIQELEYENLNKEIKRTMRRSAKDVVQIGFMLRQMAEKKMWEAAYNCLDEYLAEELHLDYSMATRFMNINRKYSVSGNSMDIAEKYEGYSQGLLVEMLNMPQELEEKVSPDMTVKQVREMKRQAKTEREEPAPSQPEKKEAVIDGEYREIKVTEKVATSQPEEKGQQEEKLSAYGLSKTVYPEGSLLTTVGCGHISCCFSCAKDCMIRQEDRYCVEEPLGDSFGCTTMEVLKNLKAEMGDKCQFINHDLADHTAGSEEPVPCCKNCTVLECDYRCRRALEMQAPDKDAAEDELSMVRRLLEKKKQDLEEWMKVAKVEEVPKNIIFEKKTIVGALASMVYDLENTEPELEEIIQPELPVLKNNDQREEWLDNYKDWGIWYRDEHIDVNYYKYDFIDGSCLVVAEYPQRQCYWKKNKMEDEHYYHLLQANKKGEKFTYNEKFRNTTDSKTYLVEFLKELQKKK